jgi:serine/threonine protein kinase
VVHQRSGDLQSASARAVRVSRPSHHIAVAVGVEAAPCAGAAAGSPLWPTTTSSCDRGSPMTRSAVARVSAGGGRARDRDPVEDTLEFPDFGPYRLEKLLGRGGMGEVYQAYDREQDRLVALKLLPVDLAKDPQFAVRFRRESAIVAKLRNPHVIPIHKYGDVNSRLFIDMRLISGSDLAEVIQAQGEIGLQRAISIVSQVASALDEAHADGIIHRDIKPSNILLTADDFAYLVDFGIAHALDRSSPLTAAESPIGTASYMAPERFTGEQYDHRTDVYSLACVLYECLTGSPPFTGDSPLQVMHGHVYKSPPNLRAYLPEYAQALDHVVSRALSKDASQRHSSAGEFANAAKLALETLGSTSSSSAGTPRRSVAVTTTDLPRWHEFAPHKRPSARPAVNVEESLRRPRQRRTHTWFATAAGGSALAVAAVFLATQAPEDLAVRDPQVRTSTPTVARSSTTQPVNSAITVSRVDVYDPTGDLDNLDRVARIVDGNQSTFWRTFVYSDQFPTLKPGLGIMITLDAPANLIDLTVTSPSVGTHVEVRSSPTANAELRDTSLLAEITLDSSSTQVHIGNNQPISHILLWIVRLGGVEGEYSTEIHEVAFQSAS